MERIRRFQRSLIISLTGINTFVYSISMELAWNKIILFTLSAMLAALFLVALIIQSKQYLKKRKSLSK